MECEVSVGLVWWITGIEIPLFAILFWLIHQGRRETQRDILKVYSEIHSLLFQIKEQRGRDGAAR